MTIERFIVLDLDRTLLDTGVYSELLLRVLLAPELQAEAREVVASSTGASFDFLEYLLRQSGINYEKAFEKVLQAVMPGDNKLLMPGAAELIAFLAISGEHHGILTTGTVPNQSLKVAVLQRITRQAIPAEVTSVPNKSADFVQNRRRGNLFYITPQLSGVSSGLMAKTIILIDDKASNLTESHPHIIAMHVPANPTTQSHTLESIGHYIKRTFS